MSGAAGLLLAGGESRRMGRIKALLDWGGQPLVRRQAAALASAGCAPVVVVLGHEADAVHEALGEGPWQVVVNTAYRSGRASSVRMGAAALPDDARAVVVTGVDQPCTASTVARLIAARAATGAAVVAPAFDGRHGHPVVFAGRLLGELRGVSEAGEGLRSVRRAHAGETQFIAVDDPLVVVNLNTPEDYAQARPLLGGGAGGQAPDG